MDGGNAPWQYKGTLDAARKMYRHEGIGAFYSGLSAALLGLTHVAIQFPLYEYFKLAFTGYGIGEHPEHGNVHWLAISLATFLSKLCASTITYPHEVIRTRLQTQQRNGAGLAAAATTTSNGGGGAASTQPMYHGIIKTCQTIFREEGWRSFYSGIGTNLFRAVPSAMTTMLTYEYLQMVIQDMRHEGEERIEEALGHGKG